MEAALMKINGMAEDSLVETDTIRGVRKSSCACTRRCVCAHACMCACVHHVFCVCVCVCVRERE